MVAYVRSENEHRKRKGCDPHCPANESNSMIGRGNVLDLLARDRMMDFQELADEARPTDLKTALRESAKKEDLKRPNSKKRPSRS